MQQQEKKFAKTKFAAFTNETPYNAKFINN